MEKQKIIEALEVIVEALKGTEVEEPKEVVKEEVVAEETSEKAVQGSFDKDSLYEMKYADLKKLASEIGVSAKGKRDEIIERILTQDVEVEEEIEIPDNVTSIQDKLDYLDMAKEATEDMSLEEIRELLEDLDYDVEGKKKKDLISLVAKALENGDIDISDDDEEDEPVEEESEEVEEVVDSDDDDDDDDEEEEVTKETYFDDYDDGTNDPEMVDSEERQKAMIKLQEDIIKDYETEALKDEDIDKFLKDALTEDELEDLEDADEVDKFGAYCELLKRMIDDSGERVPMNEPYEITVDGDVYDYCCGHELTETEEGYVCEICGSVYEAE